MSGTTRRSLSRSRGPVAAGPRRVVRRAVAVRATNTMDLGSTTAQTASSRPVRTVNFLLPGELQWE